MKTHQNFTSLNRNIPDAKTLYQIIEEFIPSIKTCHRGKPLGDTSQDVEEIDIEKWDRLYYFDCYHKEDNQYYIFHGRMEYNSKLWFFELYVRCESHSREIRNMHIFMSEDANLFMKSVLNEGDNIRLIRRSLAVDGIRLDENIEEFLKNHRKIKRHQQSKKKYIKSLSESMQRDFNKFVEMTTYYHDFKWKS